MPDFKYSFSKDLPVYAIESSSEMIVPTKAGSNKVLKKQKNMEILQIKRRL